MLRRLVGVLLAVLLTAALVPAAATAADAPPPAVTDDVRGYSIAPPGQSGDITTDELAAFEASGDCNDLGPHYCDQLEMYASLVDDNDVTDAELAKYFHSMQFGPGDTIESTYQPAAGITVYRDNFGIPHIYADTQDHASFGLGYVTAEDRMWQMDVFRHAAEGNLSELVGPGTNDKYFKMDVDTRREGYTQAEVQKMYDNFDNKFGAMGKTVQTALTAYADGVNAYEATLQTDPTKCPAEYNATGNPCPGAFPAQWTAVDTLFIVVLQLRVFGETAGGELQNAGLFGHLLTKLGPKLGPKVYNDLEFQNDPRAYTSIARSDGNFHTQKLGKVDPRSFAIPDSAVKLAAKEARRENSRRRILASFGFRAPSSNAILVSAERSATGNPVEWGAPQVGYAVPSFFMDIDVHVPATDSTPAIDFRGPAVPGTSALIPLGRGRDYAWSLTTGYSDAVDTRAELLCDPKGGKVTTESNAYVFKGRCKEMESRTEDYLIKPTPTSPSQPRMESRTVYRTQHGPVFARDKVNGKPVAFVKQRFFWKREVDSIPSFYKWNTMVHSVKDFQDAAKGFTMSFNAFYADSKDIGYFHVGMYPVRTKHVSPSLPTWGTGQWEWHGRRPFSTQPHIIDPPQGWVTNWNNKPARGWNNFDDFKWGSIHRVQLLADGLKKLFANGGKATMSDIVDVARVAATRDARGVYLGRKMVSYVNHSRTALDQSQSDAIKVIREWLRTGSNRKNADHDDFMDQGGALALFDTWYPLMVHRIFDDEIGKEGFDLIPAPVTNYTPSGGGGFWFDFSSYVRDLFNRRAAKSYALDYCDVRSTKQHETCADDARAAFNDALAKLKKAQGDDITKWSTPAENIEFTAQGAGSVPDIPWQNRGSHNHIVEILSDAG